MNRRDFMKFASIAGSTSLIASCSVTGFIPDIPKRPNVEPEDTLLWIAFADGKYTLHLPKIEMGQNISTALKQVACEELDVSWADVTVKMQTTFSINPVSSTVGSESIRRCAIPLAQACATLREAISNKQRYGVLEVVQRPLEELRIFAEYSRYIGKPQKLEQIDEITQGNPLFVSDVRLPNMLYASVIYPPTLPELPSRLLNINEDNANKIDGFVNVVRDPLLKLGVNEGIGVVAANPVALEKVIGALELQWSKPEQSVSTKTIDNMINIDTRMSEGSLSNKVDEKNWHSDAIITSDIDIRIDIPSASHKSMEPRACVADFTDPENPNIWVGNQDIFFTRDRISRRLDIPKDQIKVSACRVGGGFGGKTLCTVELEAAVISKSLNRPVKIQWSREQEFKQAFHRPPSSHRVKVSLSNGKIKTWHHAFSSSHILFTNAVAPKWLQTVTNIAVGDPGVARGADLYYETESHNIEFDLVRLPYFTGPWRGLGAGPNTLVIEAAINECARVSNIDPFVFRQRNLKNSRLKRILEKTAEAAGWKKLINNSNEKGHYRYGKGIACGIYKGMTYTATVAEVRVNPQGIVEVLRVYCGHDCGKIINPDQIKAQCEGNIMWAIGMLFSDNLTLNDSSIDTTQFFHSPPPSIQQCPDIDVLLVDKGDPPAGAGEAAIVSSLGAIYNAVSDATGIAPSKLPIQPHHLSELHHG